MVMDWVCSPRRARALPLAGSAETPTTAARASGPGCAAAWIPLIRKKGRVATAAVAGAAAEAAARAVTATPARLALAGPAPVAAHSARAVLSPAARATGRDR